jgi:ABC-type nickel/cobalt efflux system permease component RcnA
MVHRRFERLRLALSATPARLAWLALLCAFIQAVPAHLALDNEIGHETLITVHDNRIEISYSIFLNDVAAVTEAAEIDGDGDGRITQTESTAYFAAVGEMLRQGLTLQINGQPAPLRPVGEVALSQPFKKTYRLVADQPAVGAAGASLTFTDNNYPDTPGKKEIEIAAGPVIDITYCSLWADWAEIKRIIREYDLWPDSIGRDERTVTLRYGPGSGRKDPDPAAMPAVPGGTDADAEPGDEGIPIGSPGLYGAGGEAAGQRRSVQPGDPAPMGERLKKFISPQNLSPALIAMALVIALMLGMAHALTPGHGKTIVASYQIGSRGTVLDAVYLGVIVTLTHTASVYILGLIFYLAADRVPKNYNEWLMAISGLMVMGMGLWIFNLRRGGGHGHSHGHDQEHDHDHAHNHEHAHAHEHVRKHGHDHSHEARRGVSRWSLTTLGISGGLVPCPDAIIVLIFALVLNRFLWGLIIITAFSLGMAAVLIGVGVAMVLTKGAMERLTAGEGSRAGWWARQHRLHAAGGRLLAILPAASALIVALLGAGIVLKALLQAGIIRIYL